VGEALAIEVVYARAERQRVRALSVAAGTTVREAIERSGLLEEFPEIDLAQNRIGTFGRPRALDEAVQGGDRIEIYRPLPVDPKELRRRRVKR
jgi:uncharacterized protein